jgi:hypothetical protein
MSTPPARQRRHQPRLHDPIIAAGDPDRGRLQQRLARALAGLQRADATAARVVDVQPVVQLVRQAGYPAFKAARERAWADTPYSTRGWPAKLADSDYAALLLPLSAGRVGAAVGTHPRVVAEPLFAVGTPAAGRGAEDLVLGLLANWIANPPAGVGVRLAPPVIEVIGGRAVALKRRLETFALTWPLPAPDGL